MNYQVALSPDLNLSVAYFAAAVGAGARIIVGAALRGRPTQGQPQGVAPTSESSLDAAKRNPGRS
ncbi:MAG: hypothetical protein AB7P69_05340 [Candidatus Binatia bacterium]